MSQVLNLYETKKRRVLSSRETAREMSSTVSAFISKVNGKPGLTIDLADMATVTPSFFDELLHVIKGSVSPEKDDTPIIHLTNTSKSHAARFRAICRVHSLEMVEIGPGHWRISQAYSPSPRGAI